MRVDEKEKLALETLAVVALEQPHQQFEPLKNIQQLKASRALYQACKKVTKRFKALFDDYIGQYLESCDLNYLYQAKRIEFVIDYYKAEADLYSDEINEFYTYMISSGNIIKTLIGYDRVSGEQVND